MPKCDYSKLKGRIAEMGLTQYKVAEKIGITKSTMSIKLNGKGAFKQSEINSLISILQIPLNELGEYFFKVKV